jgi:uncharacterized protein DUF4158
VATQVFADEELERLREFPEIGRDELARFFTLTPADVAFVDPGRGRGRRIALAWRWRCARCRGWVSCRTRCRRRRRTSESRAHSGRPSAPTCPVATGRNTSALTSGWADHVRLSKAG